MFFLGALLCMAGVLSAFAQITAPIGGSALLYPKDAVVTPQHQIIWRLDGTSTTIASLSPGSSGSIPTYGGRCINMMCELFSNGSLRMDHLTNSDNRTYLLSLVRGTLTVSEQVQLIVYNLLNSPTLTSSPSTRPVNGTTLRLTCNGGSQTVHNIYFYRNEQMVSCSMSHLSCNPSSPFLIFNPILDIDTGNYSCAIQNPVSQRSSAHMFLNVAVKVSQVTLRKNPTHPIIVEKDSVALMCSSYGTDVSYNWTFMGSPLPQNSRYQLTDNNATVIISPVTRSDQGAFTCGVNNYLNGDISNPLNLTWLPDGQITCDAQRSGQNIQLYCSWPGAYPPAQVHMSYHSVNLIEFNGVTTMIPSAQFPLGTPLSCTGTHQGSSETCSLVIDSPQYPGFINDSTKAGRKGSSVFLSVPLSSEKAAQIFPSTFSWFRVQSNLSQLLTGEDFTIMSNDYSSILIVHYMTKEMSGRYMCKAENKIGTNSFTFSVEVEKDDVLSAGAIAGIVIACVAVLVLIALTVILANGNHICKKDFLNRKKDPKRSDDLQIHVVTPKSDVTPADRNTYTNNNRQVILKPVDVESFYANESEDGAYEEVGPEQDRTHSAK